MANVFNTLSLSNPYKDIVIPLVQAYGHNELSRQANPHEVWTAANLIKLRSDYWGENLPEGSTTDELLQSNPPVVTPAAVINSATRGAQADGPGAASPNTTLIQTLEKQLRGMVMSSPNNWIDWAEASAFFFEGVGPFLAYFENEYQSGAYSDFYRSTLGAFKHPDGYLQGLSIYGSVEGDGSTEAEFDIDFTLADSSLHHRFFIIYDTAATSTMFYYDVGDVGGFVPPVVTTGVVKIILSAADDNAAILGATKAAIDGLATYTTTVTGLFLNAVSVAVGAVTDPDDGTAAFGVNYTYNDELRASDGTVLASGITDKEDYAEKWNALKIPFEEGLGNTYPYLDPRIIGIGDPAPEAAGPCNGCLNRPGCSIYCHDRTLNCCKACPCVASSATFRTTAYPTFDVGTYNTPGNLFVAGEGRQANLTPIQDVI